MVKTASRAPSAKVANAVRAKRKLKNELKSKAEKTEAETRKKGGYGKAVCSIWDAPPGGIEKSPAYKKMLTRCECDAKGKPPPPEKRDGAPIKGGFPLNKYPPNVIVDGMRVPWLPDDCAQVIKNTGPGGVYHGWMTPEGKFCFHRNAYPSSFEQSLGRGRLTVMHGLNGIMRSVRNRVKPGADKQFLAECLSPKERKLIAPASEFHFGVVSAFRADIESGQHDIMIVEGHFRQVGVQPTWYTDASSVESYRKLGLKVKVGGKLTPARNMILDDAKAKKKVAVEISDDIGRWVYYDCEKQDFRGETTFKKANEAVLGTKKHCISPLAAAQFMLAKMRADPAKPRLAGVFPTENAAMTLGSEEFGRHHFILGDFFVAELSPCRFDCSMTLKEDYDYTCSHIKTHGSVLRCNRMFLSVKHATNSGGAVAARDAAGAKEKMNIDILQRKWPGVFRINGRRKGVAGTEVTMNWKGYDNVTEKSVPKKKVGSKIGIAMKVQKVHLKKSSKFGKFASSAVVKYTKKVANAIGKKYSPQINKRCSKLHLKTVADAIGMKYKGNDGIEKTYNMSDLKYDVDGGRLQIARRGA